MMTLLGIPIIFDLSEPGGWLAVVLFAMVVWLAWQIITGEEVDGE